MQKMSLRISTMLEGAVWRCRVFCISQAVTLFKNNDGKCTNSTKILAISRCSLSDVLQIKKIKNSFASLCSVCEEQHQTILT